MVTITLKNGITVIPTSFHGCRFSDGTVFDPTPEEITQIRSDWACLQGGEDVQGSRITHLGDQGY